jgi:regulator of replication initiation timing
MTAFEQVDLNSIPDVAGARRAIGLLFNLIEDQQATIRQLQAENQQLRDENKRLKGEQGKPDIKPNKPPARVVSSCGPADKLQCLLH